MTSATPQRQLDQAIGRCSAVALVQGVLDGFVADDVGEAIGTQQVTIVRSRLANSQCRLDLVAGQRPHDQRSLRVGMGLFGGDASLVDERLNERVVSGDLRQHAVTK